MKNEKAEAAILDLLGDDAITLDTIDDFPSTKKRELPTKENNYNFLDIVAKKKESLALISCERCEPWKYADRSEEEMGNLESLANSIKNHGQQEPILVRPKENPLNEVEYEIIFGNRRWRACATLNIPVKAIIKPLTDQEAAISQKEENENREGISDYSRAIFYKKILDNGLFPSTGSLASSMGIGKSTLLDLLSYTRINHDLMAAIPSPHKLSRKAAAKLAALSFSLDKQGIEQLIHLAPDIAKGKISTRNIEFELNKKLNPSSCEEIKEPLFSVINKKNGEIIIFIKDQRSLNVDLEEIRLILTQYLEAKNQSVGRPTTKTT